MKKIFTLALSIIISSSIFAAAEFFVKINSNGNYTVSLNNQTITSSTNTFRFFDLYAGNFNLKVSLVSPNGCRSEKNFTNKIISLEKPTAAFDLLSNSLTLRMPDLQVKNNSSPVKTYLWDFGDGGSSILANPSYTYQTQGSFVVQLLVIHENGCSDTARNLVTVGVANDFFIPNTFTPNGDGNNDIFLPVGIEGQLGQYTLTVIDRWGSMVFQSTEQSQGWDGTWYRTTNKIAQDGVYIYMIRFITEEGNEKIVKGSVTLIR